MWIILAFGSAVFAGLTAILAKIGIKNMDSNLATALRTSIVVIFAWLLVFITGPSGASILPKTLLFLVLSGIATGASWLCYFKALQLGDVNKVAPIDKSSTVLTMLLAALFLGEQITPVKTLSILLIGAGTFLMIEKKDLGEDREVSGGWLPYALLSAVFASLTAILGKIGIQDIDSNLGTAIRTIVVLIMAWAIVFCQGSYKGIKNIDKKSWAFLTLSGLSTGLSWLSYYRALQDGPASVVIPIDKLSILVTVLLARFLFGERLKWKPALGLLLIVSGTFLLLIG